MRGAEAKQTITNKILSTFSDSFIYDKEIRIPITESDGQTVQIKCVLTCAKVAVEAGTDKAVPGVTPAKAEDGVKEITTDEKNEVNDLISALGL